MKAKIFYGMFLGVVMLLITMTTSQIGTAQSKLDCSLCHKDIYQQWQQGSHAHTQMDVATELSEERVGQSPDTVINGSDAEDCIACHSPLAVTVNGGMTEAEALGHFYTTTNGVFTDSTTVADTTNWPNNWCTTCHNVPANHPLSMPVFGYFNSKTTQYDTVANVPSLCGQCHGNLHFEDTDHLTYNAWTMSKHANTQDDVAGELSEERTGESPDTVLHGSDAENCIACHAPTAVLANGGMTEAEALGHFFSTVNDTFSSSTAAINKDEWPNVNCISCHNPHVPNKPSYFNSGTKEYEAMSSTEELCGQCHGSLRFPDTDHRSYNIEKGIGAVGVTFKETMTGVTCTDCHMYSSDVDGSNSAMYHGHTWDIFVNESDGSKTASCTSCHSSINAASAESIIKMFKAETQMRLDSAVQVMQTADSLMQGNTDPNLQTKLSEAHQNLFLVESDESGGFHNQKYQMDLLADVIQRSKEIIAATPVQETKTEQLPKAYALFQNYPNPFNPSTHINYTLPERTPVTIEVFDLLGERVRVLVNGTEAAGSHSVTWNGRNDFGKSVPGGVYIYRIQTDRYKAIRKMVLLK